MRPTFLVSPLLLAAAIAAGQALEDDPVFIREPEPPDVPPDPRYIRIPFKAPKPWEKWTQHPKSPRAAHFKKARRQPGT